MVKIDKSKALFIKGVVIANGIPDTDGDTLSKKEIKQLISSYLSHQTDTDHDRLLNLGVKIIENYISQTEEKIGGHKIPEGSWITCMIIWDENLISRIRQGRLNGLSLLSQPDPDAKQRFEKGPNHRKTYREYLDMDSLTPTFISIVKNPANQIPFDYFSYDEYITKNKAMEENTVSEETKELSAITNKLIDTLLMQNGVNNDPVVKAAPPQGGMVPTMQPQYSQAQQQSEIGTLNQKLDQIIQLLNATNTIQKSADGKKKKGSVSVPPKKEGTTTTGNEGTDGNTTTKTVETTGEGGNKTESAGTEGVAKEGKTNDETGQPSTKEGNATLNQVPPTPNNNVTPNSNLQGANTTPKTQRQIVKSAPSVTENATPSQPILQNYDNQSIGTERDPFGRPIR